MGDKSRIEWTDATWNPTTGCDRISPGCDHCYALTYAARLKAAGMKRYQNDGHPATSGPGFGLTLQEDVLELPFSWKRPRRVFVNSMSDLFHARVPFEFVKRVWNVMFRTPQHTYQILTKRPDRMARFTQELPFTNNVWLGTSVEDQLRADQRLPHLVDRTWGAVRFVSVEPMLGPVNLRPWLGPQAPNTVSRLQWVIVGGESGHGHRPMDLAWVRQLRDQCQDSGTAFFFKQVGGFTPKAGGRVLDGRTWDEFPDRQSGML